MIEQAGPSIGRYQQLPLVGRNAERDRLRHCLLETEKMLKEHVAIPNDPSLSCASSTRRSFALLLGEVGIGKTRLAEETAREAIHRGWSVVWSRAYAQESHVPFRLWSQVLRDIVQRDLWPQYPTTADMHLYQSLTTLLPELLDLLTLPTLAHSVMAGQGIPEALLTLLTAICEQRKEPVLLVLDDLQWTDESSCELLGYLARRMVNTPVLFVGTVRENEIPPSHPLWSLNTNMQRERTVEQIQVEALSNEHIAALIAHVPSSLTRLIQRQVAGNPFFAEELARAYSTWTESEKGVHRQTGLTLPRTIADVLDQRLQFLSPECQRFLQRAAVLGSSLSFDSLHLMENKGGTQLPDDSLFTLLEEALQAKVLTEEQSGTTISYHFWHPLLMSHLYEKLSATRRIRLHQHASAIFCQLYATSEEEGAAIIVHHLQQGNAPSSQIAYYAELAGDHAYALAAYPAAENYYQLTIEHTQHSVAPQTDACLHQASLLERLGECMRFQGHFQDAGHCFEKALELHRQAYPSLQSLTGREKLQEAQMQAMLCCGIGISWYDQDNCALARQYYHAVERVLYEVGIVDGPVWAYLFLQYSYLAWHEGMHSEAQNAAQNALLLFEAALQEKRTTEQLLVKTRLRRTLAGDPVDLGRTYLVLGLPAGATGQLSVTISYLTISLKIFEQYDCLREIAIVCCNLGDVYLRRAEYASAQDYLRRAQQLAERIGDTSLQCFIAGNLGLLALRTENLAESENWYRHGLKNALQINEAYSSCLLSTFLAFILLKQKKYDEVAPCLRRAFTLQRNKRIPGCAAMIWVVLGYVRLSQVLASYGPDRYRKPCDVSDTAIKMQSLLVSARVAVEHALAIPGTDIEIKAEAGLLQAHICMFLVSLEEALRQAFCILEDARQHELKWIVEQAESLIESLQALKIVQQNETFRI
ncbi:MAG: AAA family ATPase [Ktedonobacteraceae bacterium]|nr:AAA family ATPase [Ktedonobacteraceae bacterium]